MKHKLWHDVKSSQFLFVLPEPLKWKFKSCDPIGAQCKKQKKKTKLKKHNNLKDYNKIFFVL